MTPLRPWSSVRACLQHNNPAEQISARAAFLGHTRAGWRAARYRNPMAGQLVPGAPASFAVWEVEELMVQVADGRVQSWSTDPRARTPLLPALDTGNDPAVPPNSPGRPGTLRQRCPWRLTRGGPGSCHPAASPSPSSGDLIGPAHRNIDLAESALNCDDGHNRQVTARLTDHAAPVALRVNGGLRSRRLRQSPVHPKLPHTAGALLVMTMGTPRGRVHFAAENGSGAAIRGLPELARSGWTCPGVMRARARRARLPIMGSCA